MSTKNRGRRGEEEGLRKGVEVEVEREGGEKKKKKMEQVPVNVRDDLERENGGRETGDGGLKKVDGLWLGR